MRGVIYLIGAEEPCRRLKIGYSCDSERRRKELERCSPLALDVIAQYLCDNTLTEERAWHERLADYRLHGEWFELPAKVEFDVMTEFFLRQAADEGCLDEMQALLLTGIDSALKEVLGSREVVH